MKKLPIRLVTLLLISCLLVDPSTAADLFASSSNLNHLFLGNQFPNIQAVFQKQALVAARIGYTQYRSFCARFNRQSFVDRFIARGLQAAPSLPQLIANFLDSLSLKPRLVPVSTGPLTIPGRPKTDDAPPARVASHWRDLHRVFNEAENPKGGELEPGRQ